MKKLVLFTMASAFSALSIAGAQSFNLSPGTKAYQEDLAKKQAQTKPQVQAPVTPAPKPVAPPTANAQKPTTSNKVHSTKAPN
jgi:hypothetical protein